MSARVAILAFIAFISAIGTTMMVRSWVASERAAAAAAPTIDVPPPPPMPEVLVAAEGLPAGMIIKPQHVRWQAWPAESIAEGYAVKDKDGMQSVIGSVVRTGIASGEPIVESRIVRPGDRGFLAAILTPGMRAISVPVNATSGIAGLIFPGDRVDVILTHTINGEGGQDERVRRASETVLENIRVLATDQRTDHEDGSAGVVAKTATLEVTPKEAEILSVVTELGRLSLSLRSIQIPEPTEGAAETAVADAVATPVVPQDERTGRSYTLDSNVSMLLDDPGRKGRGSKGRQVDVVRGKDLQQVTF